MTEINAQSQQTLDSLLTKLGAKKLDTSGTKSYKSTLGQEYFLKLMTAQLSNQDPFQPQSNDQMIAQMAQFSTVSGITQLNSTLSGIQTQISENRIATAAKESFRHPHREHDSEGFAHDKADNNPGEHGR